MGVLAGFFGSDTEPTIGNLRVLLNEALTNQTRLEAEIKVMETNMGDPNDLSDNARKQYEAMINARESLNKLINFISGIKL